MHKDRLFRIAVIFCCGISAFCSKPESRKEEAPAVTPAARQATAAPNPPGAVDPYQAGLKALFAKDWERARSSFEAVKPDNPNYVTALNNLGILAEKASDYPKALAYHKKILEVEPKNAEAHANLGWLCFLQGNYQESIKESNAALTYNPNLLTALYNLGLACAADENNGAAMEALRHAVDRDGQKKLCRTAIEDFAGFLSRKPEALSARFCLAFLYRSVGETNREKEELEKLIAMTPPESLRKEADERLAELNKAGGTIQRGNQ